ncbi:Dabb family protein [Clostridium bovifaecis]|uniref:Dabb family protein n=1 Tax=Clostridium bovifaecis TaxID=2184719 RepID=A0A6I6EZ77_9CLOT|nr:Dabb family protein [Clostridium bovifaecis]
MFTHVVFFKLKEPTIENMRRAKSILEGMKGNIPQLKGIEVGTDVVRSQRSYDICLITRFDSQEEMDKYQVHPYHVNEVLKNLKPMLDGSAAVDY